MIIDETDDDEGKNIAYSCVSILLMIGFYAGLILSFVVYKSLNPFVFCWIIYVCISLRYYKALDMLELINIEDVCQSIDDSANDHPHMKMVIKNYHINSKM